MIQNNTLQLIVFQYDSTLEEYQVAVALEKPIYIEYSDKYSEEGSAKLVFVLSAQNSQYLKEGNIIWIETNVCMNIRTSKITSENTITVWGSLCDALPKSRAIFEEITFEDDYLSDVFYELFNSIDPIPGVTMSTFGLPMDVTYTGTIQIGNFLDTIISLCKKFDLGFKARKASSGLEPLEINFVVFSGTDKSESVIISKEYNSVSDFEYSLDLNDQINFVKVIGENNISVDVQTPDAESYQIQAVLKSSTSQGSMTEQEYENVLTEEGQKYLSEHTEKETYSGTYTGNSFVYNTDFSMGDKVKIEDTERNFNTTKRVTEYRKQMDSSGVYETLYFGDFQKTIQNVISSISKKVENVKPAVPSGGGSTVTLGAGLEYDQQGRIKVKLGDGLTFDENGAIKMAYNPVVNISHALVYKKE